MSAECSPVASDFPVLADSPLGSPTPLPSHDLIDEAVLVEPLHFVLVKYVDGGMWRTWVRDNGSEAVATTIELAEAYLKEAKKTLSSVCKPKNGEPMKPPAVGLRIASSPNCEL